MSSVDFSKLLTTEQKRSLLTQRIAQFAAEGYQHELNKVAAGENTEAVAAADEAITVLSAAITAHQEELTALPEETPAE